MPIAYHLWRDIFRGQGEDEREEQAGAKTAWCQQGMCDAGG